MEEMEIREWLQDVPSIELASMVESIFSLDCMKHSAVREAILQFEEHEQEVRVDDYTDDEVFTRYLEFRELLGNPVNLTEYLADRREWEYYSQGVIEDTDYWGEYERARTGHALELLAEYEKNTGK